MSAPYQDAPDTAQRLRRQIQASLSDRLTPAQMGALIALKGLCPATLCQRAMIDLATFTGWMKGDIPILPDRKFDLLELMVGFEQGALVTDRVHLLNLDEARVPSAQLAHHLSDIEPMLRGALKSMACNESGKNAGQGGSKLYVVELVNAAITVVSHTQRARFGANAVAQRLSGINWAAHGAATEGAASTLMVEPALAERLRAGQMLENDATCSALAELYSNAKQLKSSRSLGAIKNITSRAR